MLTAVPNLTIANGGTTSDVLEFGYCRLLRGLSITGPSALTGTVTVEISKGRSGTEWSTLQSGGADVTITAAKTTVIEPLIAGRLRLKSSGAEGAERVFKLQGNDR